ncbi:MAG: MlaD family protein [Sediminibacterium sp.]
MEKQNTNNIKLGVFVLAGLGFLVLLLYMIGKNKSFFGSNFILKAQFENVQGLKAGNNVRYAGIEIGTVHAIHIINDTVLEVEMSIDEKVRATIHKNATVAIGTDGLVGNKVVNISATKIPASAVDNGDILPAKKPVDTDEMLRTLSITNNDIAVIAANLKATIAHINDSKAFWNIMNDKGLPRDLKLSAANIRMATAKANDMIQDLNSLTTDLKNGKGSLGRILTDTTISNNLNSAILTIKGVGNTTDSLSRQISKTIQGIEYDIQNGKGMINTLLKDTSLVTKLSNSMDNIRKGTDGFNQNMEALKHNFLFSGYFKKLEKQKQKDEKQKTLIQK